MFGDPSAIRVYSNVYLDRDRGQWFDGAIYAHPDMMERMAAALDLTVVGRDGRVLVCDAAVALEHAQGASVLGGPPLDRADDGAESHEGETER